MVCLSHLFLGIFLFAFRQVTGVPDPDEAAKMARYIVNNTDWASVSSISTIPGMEGYPFVGLEDTADGGSGIPYMYVTNMDQTIMDININNETTLMMTLAQTDYCQQQNYDQEDPLCARVMLTGSLLPLEVDSDEENFAETALFSEHPQMQYWPSDHGFYFVKLNITQVLLFDNDGVFIVSSEDYFAANAFS